LAAHRPRSTDRAAQLGWPGDRVTAKIVLAYAAPLANGGGGGSLVGMSPVLLPVIGFLVAFSAVYYAMLIFAPRQVADREGGLVVWALRYLMFLGGIALGTGWPRVH
jgi:hypothetical protein